MVRQLFNAEGINESMVYATNATVNYADKRLFVLWLAVSMIFPIYVLWGAAHRGEYQEKIETEYFFTIDASDSFVNIKDLIAGNRAINGHLFYDGKMICDQPFYFSYL